MPRLLIFKRPKYRTPFLRGFKVVEILGMTEFREFYCCFSPLELYLWLNEKTKDNKQENEPLFPANEDD